MKIKLLNTMQSSVIDGNRVIPVGTEMEQSGTYLSWTYFKGNGYTLVLMGWAEAEKQQYLGNLKIIN